MAEYTYNALDLIEKVTDNGTVTAEYSYYPDGSIRSLKNGSLYTEYAFDADKNLTGLKTMLGTEVLADNHYTYDFNGNRTEKRQTNGTTRYAYDALNQLNKVQYPSYTEELYYDRAGNRTRRIAKGVEELYKYDPRNRLTEYTKGGVTTQFTYDNAGNLLKDDKAKYTYDTFNRTEKVETFDGHVQINRYDAEGLRHEMEEDGRLVQFIFRGDEIATEEKDNSVIRYIRGYDLIASDAESARTYYHYASDEMSSITHVVDGTDVRNHYEYDAWGNTTTCKETVENRFRFNGQQYDPITQQYYLRARFYNPVIARFTQEDTYRGDGLNLYAYCANNPVYYEDPSGYKPNCVKQAIAQYVKDGMSRKDASKLAWAEYYDRKLADINNLTPKEVKKYQTKQERIQNRLQPGKRDNQSVWGIIYQAEHLTGYDYNTIRKKAGIGDVGKLKVLAIYNHDGKYMDVNPEARAVRPPAGIPISFGVNDPKQSTRNLSPWGRGNPSTTRGVHPDTNTMLQSKSKGGVGILSVIGRNVCSSCQTNTRLVAASQDLSNLVVNEYTSGNVYLFNGYNEYFSTTYKEGVSWKSGIVSTNLNAFE